MGTYVRQPVEFVRGEGTRLWDSDGQRVPRLPERDLRDPARPLPPARGGGGARPGRAGSCTWATSSTPSRRCGWRERLADASLGGKVFFCNSGAEAIECAIKLARRRKPGGRFVVLEGGFHGRTMGALSATPQETKQAPFAPLVPGFSVAPRGGPLPVDDDVAAVIIEPVQGEGGIHPVDPELLAAAREACDAPRRAARARRDPVRDGPHGHALGLAAAGHRAGRDDRGQGTRRRPADRRVRGLARARRRAPAGRPRLHLRRRPGGHGGRQRRARHDRRRGVPRRRCARRACGWRPACATWASRCAASG